MTKVEPAKSVEVRVDQEFVCYVRLGYCFSPYQRLWLYNGVPLVAFYDTLGIRRTYSRLKPPTSSRGNLYVTNQKETYHSTRIHSHGGSQTRRKINIQYFQNLLKHTCAFLQFLLQVSVFSPLQAMLLRHKGDVCLLIK